MKKINAIPPALPKKDKVRLTPDEAEAVRLVDYLGMSQEEAAQKMGVSQPTISRLLANARLKLSSTLFEPKEPEVVEPKRDFEPSSRLAFLADEPSENAVVSQWPGRASYIVVKTGDKYEIHEIPANLRGMWQRIHYILSLNPSGIVMAFQPGPMIAQYLSQNGVALYIYQGKINEFNDIKPVNPAPSWWPGRWGRMRCRYWW